MIGEKQRHRNLDVKIKNPKISVLHNFVPALCAGATVSEEGQQ